MHYQNHNIGPCSLSIAMQLGWRPGNKTRTLYLIRIEDKKPEASACIHLGFQMGTINEVITLLESKHTIKETADLPP